ncbi:MAG: hypothetical protein HYT75_01205 [Deltaproteobacteria bacterium]|nr:hypothetical protein [Deltaproteobacteria bacterium]
MTEQSKTEQTPKPAGALKPIAGGAPVDDELGTKINPPTSAEMVELERAIDIISADPDVARRIIDNKYNLYGKAEILALARINPVEARDLLYTLWGNTIMIIRGATTADDADAYFKELEQAGDLDGPPQRTKALLDAIDASPWLARAFSTKAGFDIEKVRAGYALYEKYVKEMVSGTRRKR